MLKFVLATTLKKYGLSAGVLVAVNLLPLAGVILWGWSVFELVLLYWAENVFIGVINVLKMIVASPDLSKLDGKLTGIVKKLPVRGEEGEEAKEAMKLYAEKVEEHGEKIEVAHHASKLFFVPFFCVHYGLFCFVHGMFVMVLLGGEGRMFGMRGPGEFAENVAGILLRGPLFLSALALGGSHLFSFFANFLGKGEFRKTGVPLLMHQPYGRIVVLHLAIIFGAFATMLFGSPVFLLVILIGGKICLDVKFHLRERAAT